MKPDFSACMRKIYEQVTLCVTPDHVQSKRSDAGSVNIFEYNIHIPGAGGAAASTGKKIWIATMNDTATPPDRAPLDIRVCSAGAEDERNNLIQSIFDSVDRSSSTRKGLEKRSDNA